MLLMRKTRVRPDHCIRGYMEVSDDPDSSSFISAVGKSLTRLGSRDGRRPRDSGCRQRLRNFFKKTALFFKKMFIEV